jgi:hypothetical protein
MPMFTKVVLFTDHDGQARFRDEDVALDHGTLQSALSALMPSGGYQLRTSPVGFRSQFHCTTDPQWVIILSGQMEISLQDGSARVFGPGNISIRPTFCPRGKSLMPHAMVIGAARSGRIHW